MWGRGGSQGTRIKAVFRGQIRKSGKQCKRWAVQRGEVQTEATTRGRETMELQAQGILKAMGVDVMCSPHPQGNVHQRKSLRMEPGENQCLLKDRRIKRSFKGGSNGCSGSQDLHIILQLLGVLVAPRSPLSLSLGTALSKENHPAQVHIIPPGTAHMQ